MTYRLFIDSANPGDWDLGLSRGWLHGVTTNPLIISRAGKRVELATARTWSPMPRSATSPKSSCR